MNPIINVAFDLSQARIRPRQFRGVEGAGRPPHGPRLRAPRARLRERTGYTDHSATIAEFSSFVDETATSADDSEAAFEAFKARWSRARTGVVLTAHPVRPLRAAVAAHDRDRDVEPSTDNVRVGHPHRPDDRIDLGYEHARVQRDRQPAIGLRRAAEQLLRHGRGPLRRKRVRRAPEARHLRLLGRLRPRRAHRHPVELLVPAAEGEADRASEVRERFLAIRHQMGEGGDTLRLTRQITGKLDLAIAAVDEQIAALENVGAGSRGLAQAASSPSRAATATTSSPRSRSSA